MTRRPREHGLQVGGGLADHGERLPFRVACVRAADAASLPEENLLAAFRFGDDRPGNGGNDRLHPHEIGVSLPQAGGEALIEAWISNRSVDRQWIDGVAVACDGNVLIAHVAIEDDAAAMGLEAATRSAYQAVARAVVGCGYRSL
ncbi:MAG: hypothetical protein HC834_05870, partial [Rhodospirillales bacterium]|nr:hypothetical protein [Rhodospirillales bacterium]